MSMMNSTMSNNTNLEHNAGALQWGFLAFIGVLLLACLVCNGLILAVFTIEKTIRNQTNIFVVSLACADLVVGMVSMPMWIANSAPQITLWYYLNSIDVLCCAASIFNCALLSLERALKITCPFWYANTVTTDKVKFVIMVGWFASILVGGLSLTRGNDENNIPYITFISLVIYVIPVLAIAFSYVSIFVVARKHSQKIRKQFSGIAGEFRIRLESDAKTARNLSIFIAVFVICWTPVFIKIWVGVLFDVPVLPVPFLVLSCTLPYVNAVINPFLYALANPSFRKGMKRLYRRKKTISRNAMCSSKRIESSTLNTNINNSQSSSRIASQFSPKSNRRDVSLSLLKRYSSEVPAHTHSNQSHQPLLENNSIWETSI